MVSAWVPNKYYELREHPYGRPARSRAPALLVIAIAIKLPAERNADDSSREKNEPIGLNRAYLADNRDLLA